MRCLVSIKSTVFNDEQRVCTAPTSPFISVRIPVKAMSIFRLKQSPRIESTPSITHISSARPALLPLIPPFSVLNQDNISPNRRSCQFATLSQASSNTPCLALSHNYLQAIIRIHATRNTGAPNSSVRLALVTHETSRTSAQKARQRLLNVIRALMQLSANSPCESLCTQYCSAPHIIVGGHSTIIPFFGLHDRHILHGTTNPSGMGDADAHGHEDTDGLDVGVADRDGVADGVMAGSIFLHLFYVIGSSLLTHCPPAYTNPAPHCEVVIYGLHSSLGSPFISGAANIYTAAV